VPAEDPSFPLESVKTSGSPVPTAMVIEMSGLTIGAKVNKTSIEDACQKLDQRGDIYDFLYAGDFVNAFAQVVDLRRFKYPKTKTEEILATHVANLTVFFESK
jgi:hypothetical protein